MYSIYKLTDLDTGRVYIGSTKQGIKKRLSKHKYEVKIGRSLCTCKDFNWQNVEVEELEVVEVDHLQREKYHIQNNDCVNKVRPILSEEEKKEWQKEYDKERHKIKITCECGSIITRGALWNHKRTNKHQKFLEQQQ